MKRFIALTLVAVIMLSCCSCTVKGSGKSIAYPISASPSTLDPQFAKDIEAQMIINNIFEGLVRLDSEGNVVSGIAEDWDISDDELTYTFHLKDNTEWFCPASIQNEFGKEFFEHFSNITVTAHDFVFAFRRAVLPETQSANAYKLFPIKNAVQVNSGAYGPSLLGVTAVDDYTLKIELEEPVEDFLERLTESVFMPCNQDFFEATNGRYGLSNRHILCNGPFYISSWNTETSLTIKNNKYYSGEQDVYPATVVFSYDPDNSSVAKKISSGSASAALLPPDVATPEKSTVVKTINNATFGFFFNCSDAVMSNANIRFALCSSMDRSLFGVTDNAAPQSGIVPMNCTVGSFNYREAVGSQTYDFAHDNEAAKEYWQTGLAELGRGTVSLTVLCPEWMDSAVRQQLQIWQQVLGVSIGITIETKSAQEISAAVTSGNYQIALTDIESDYNNTADFLSSFTNGGVFRFTPPGYVNVIDNIFSADTHEKMLEECFAAETLLLSNAVCYPLYSRSSRFVISEEVEGIYMPGAENTVCFIGALRHD